MTRDELGDLYERYGYLVHRRCRHLLGSDSDAGDAMQEVFMRAYRYPPREVKSMLGWLQGIALRVCLDQLAARKRSETWATQAVNKVRELLGAEAPRDQPVLRLSLASELAALDEVTRQMAVLHFLGGMTQEEVAAETGYSRKTVGIKLKSAQDRLRSMLDESASDGGETCPAR